MAAVLWLTSPGPPVRAQSPISTINARRTIRAARVESLRVDGTLDEPFYTLNPPATDFTQIEPTAGAPATERTEVWVGFDDEYVYITVRAWESAPERMIVNEMRRDSETIIQNENFAFLLDTFHDGRSGVVLQFNPNGGRMDGQVTNEKDYNTDWNPVWDLAMGTFEGGWTAEAALPFKSLRYDQRQSLEWGFNARRINRWKNEISYFAPVADGQGADGILQVSRAATLTGLQPPPAGRNIEIKPYGVADLTSVRTTDSRGLDHVLGGDLGVDVKYGVTQSLTADFTYNTDFAQVEADEEQINLTRFPLFFPEKREFFLENQGIFQFGGASGGGDVPILFYSRRIGLDGGLVVPILGGARLTGRLGPFSIGAINIQAAGDDDEGRRETGFTVLRLRRDILRRSSVGAMYKRRSVSTSGPDTNEAYGVDGSFRFFDNVSADTYWATSRTAGRPATASDTSYRYRISYEGDRYGLVVHRLKVGKDFNPESGFVFREDFSKYFTRARFSPRPASIPSVRKFLWQGTINYFENGTGRLVTRELQGTFNIEFENSDLFELEYADTYDLLERPFAITPQVTIPAGRYSFGELTTAFTLGRQRTVSGRMFLERGTFYGGHHTAVGYSQGRIGLTPQLSVEPTVSINRVSLPGGSFTSNLVGSRVTYTITPQMFVSGLVQYVSSAHALSANVRLRWEYQPGSELFVVFNETRDTLGTGFPLTENRAVIVKMNRLLRY